MAGTVATSRASVRRLAIARQHLSGPLPRRATADAIVALVGELGYVQWDPVAIVAPSHLLSLWARLGPVRPAMLDRLLWSEKRLFEHWTPMASLVRTDDYPLFASLMERYPESLSRSWGRQRLEAKRFITRHPTLRENILRELRDGPRVTAEFSDHAPSKRADSNWNPASDLSEMVYHLLMAGKVMVVGHRGAQNVWGLSDGFLPPSTDRRGLAAGPFERAAARRALHALGTGTPAEIKYYFVRGRYERLPTVLNAMERDGEVRRVRVDGFPAADHRYILTDDLEDLAAMETDAFEPRMSLVPPFDNLIASTARTQRLFDFTYVREQFLPAAKRRYGTYVLPIVHGDRLIGRIDPRLDRASGTLVIQAVHAEPNAPDDREVATTLDRAIRSLAASVGATEVQYSGTVPDAWKRELH